MKFKNLIATAMASLSLTAFAADTIIGEGGTLYDLPRNATSMSSHAVGYVHSFDKNWSAYGAAIFMRDTAAGTSYSDNLELGSTYSLPVTKYVSINTTLTLGQKSIPNAQFTYWAAEPAVRVDIGNVYAFVGYRFRQAVDSSQYEFYTTQTVKSTVGYKLPQGFSVYYRHEDVVDGSTASGKQGRANYIGLTKTF
jgi:hypothetical protein